MSENQHSLRVSGTSLRAKDSDPLTLLDFPGGQLVKNPGVTSHLARSFSVSRWPSRRRRNEPSGRPRTILEIPRGSWARRRKRARAAPTGFHAACSASSIRFQRNNPIHAPFTPRNRHGIMAGARAIWNVRADLTACARRGISRPSAKREECARDERSRLRDSLCSRGQSISRRTKVDRKIDAFLANWDALASKRENELIYLIKDENNEHPFKAVRPLLFPKCI